MSEVLCLKWNNHKSIFLQNLSNLRTQELYSDATITCNGKYFSVHRLVLSTCSEYFEEIFERISTQSIHPFIIITNIESGYLEALLNFMYNGEVNVLHEMLPGLIKAAEILKIKGLAIPDEESIEKELIHAREREATNVNKEQTTTAPIPVSSQSIITQSTNSVISSKPSSACREVQVEGTHPTSTYALPSTNIHHQTTFQPGSTICNNVVAIESNMYSTLKGEMIEICSENQATGFYSANTESHDISRDQDEIKLEEGMLATEAESIQMQASSQSQHAQIHVPQPASSPVFSAQHIHLPPTHSQSSTAAQQGFTVIHQEPVCTFSPMSAAVHQPFVDDDKDSHARTDQDTDRSINAKTATWDSSVGITNKELEANSVAAAAVQEVIQGLLLPTSEQEIIDETYKEDVDLSKSCKEEKPIHSPEEMNSGVRSHLRSSTKSCSIINTRSHSPPSPSSDSLNSTNRKCPKCSYISKYASTLRRHIMFKHTGEKPHECNFCPYRTAHNFNMKKHMMTHTGEKPFSCPLCSYKATQNCNIKVHMKSHENKLLRAAIKGTKKH